MHRPPQCWRSSRVAGGRLRARPTPACARLQNRHELVQVVAFELNADAGLEEARQAFVEIREQIPRSRVGTPLPLIQSENENWAINPIPSWTVAVMSGSNRNKRIAGFRGNSHELVP